MRFMSLGLLFVCFAAVVNAGEKGFRVGVNGAECSHLNIGLAISAAGPGDTIYVSEGTYNEQPGLVDKSLAFRVSDSDCATVTNGEVVVDGGGGAGGIFNFDGPGRPIDVSFIGFRLTDANRPAGGLVLVENANVEFSQSALESGVANLGGCAYVRGGSLSFTASTLSQCGAFVEGGAVYVDNGSFSAVQTTFIGNGAPLGGALVVALNNEQRVTASIEGSTYQDNTASDQGGAIWFEGADRAQDALSIAGTTFLGNTTSENGGAIAAVDVGLLDVRNSTFNGNDTTNSATNQGGGAIYVFSSNRVLLDDVDFINNESDNLGGALLVSSVDVVDVSNGLIQQNVAQNIGGGIYSAQSDLRLLGTLVDDNSTISAVGLGGGVGTTLSEVLASGVTFQDNSANRGAAIRARATTLRLDNARFVGNTAAEHGGALLLTATEAIVRSVSTGSDACSPSALGANTYCAEFNDNTAFGRGGVAYIERRSTDGDPSHVTFDGVAMLANRASENGLAIYVSSEYAALSEQAQSLTLRNVLIQDSEPSALVMSPREALFVGEQADAVLESVTMAGNVGAALVAEEPDASLSLRNTLLWDNSAPSLASLAAVEVALNCAYSEPEAPGSWNLGTGVDPMFVSDLDRGDYRLDPLASPLLDVCGDGPIDDLDGGGRPADAGWEPGAFEVDPVALALIDVDPAAGLQTSEQGDADSLEVQLRKAPLDDVVLTVVSTNPNEAVVDTAELTFTPLNWNTPQTIAVTGVDDAHVDGDQPFQIRFGSPISDDAAYDGLPAILVPGTNEDDDTGSDDLIFADGFD